MQKILQYFNKEYGWNSYAGKDSAKPVEIHTMLRSTNFAENAAWIGKIEKFVVGQGGETIANLTESPSVLGHEYTHAIVQFSSGLVYRGESGAINEHFADIQGASIEAKIKNNGKFGYTVGSDVLTAQTAENKKNVIPLILGKLNYSESTINSFNLYKPAIRNLYAPAVSFASQIGHMDEFRLAYPEDCQPSIDNDNCGVHIASGILNRAASLIISALGFEKTKKMFFDTVVSKLNSTASFSDYLMQLFNECKTNPDFKASDCDVVLAGFAKVGVYHSLLPSPPLNSTGASQNILGENSSLQTQSLLSRQEYSSLTPDLKICGYVDVEQDFIEIEDGKVFPLIVKSNHHMKSMGDSSSLKEGDCACVSGSLTHTFMADGKVRSAFANFHVSRSQCIVNSKGRVRRFAVGQVPQDPKMSHQGAIFCGWIKIDANQRQIQVMDNKYNSTLILSEQRRSVADTLFSQQCGCITGSLEKWPADNGEVLNRFRENSVQSVSVKPVADCAHIPWK